MGMFKTVFSGSVSLPGILLVEGGSSPHFAVVTLKALALLVQDSGGGPESSGRPFPLCAVWSQPLSAPPHWPAWRGAPPPPRAFKNAVHTSQRWT